MLTRIDKDGQTNFQRAEPALSKMDSRHTRTLGFPGNWSFPVGSPASISFDSLGRPG